MLTNLVLQQDAGVTWSTKFDGQPNASPDDFYNRHRTAITIELGGSRPLDRRFRLASIVYQLCMDMPVRMFRVRKDIGEWKGDGWEGYRWRREVFPKTLNAQGLRLEAAVCQAPYSGRLFEYSSNGSEYVLHATPFWEKRQGWVLEFSPPDLAWRFPAPKAVFAESEE